VIDFGGGIAAVLTTEAFGQYSERYRHVERPVYG
jgi:hypothetical protein